MSMCIYVFNQHYVCLYVSGTTCSTLHSFNKHTFICETCRHNRAANLCVHSLEHTEWAVFFYLEKPPHTNPNTDSFTISRFWLPKLYCALQKFVKLCSLSQLTPGVFRSIPSPVWEVCLAREMKKPIIIITKLFHAVWCKSGEISKDLTKAGDLTQI